MTDPSSAAAPFGAGYGAQAATQLAGLWRRFAAYLVDVIIVGALTSVVGAILGAIVHYSGADSTGASIRGGVVGLVLGVLYFGYMWSRSGQTLGYMALGLRLVRADGQPISFGLAMVRYLMIYLSFLLCLVPAIISAFMIGSGERKQGIHDRAVGTIVVRA